MFCSFHVCYMILVEKHNLKIQLYVMPKWELIWHINSWVHSDLKRIFAIKSITASNHIDTERIIPQNP